MPDHAQLLDAAATITVVVAAHLGQWRAARRREHRRDKRLDRCATELRELRELVERWSGLA